MRKILFRYLRNGSTGLISFKYSYYEDTFLVKPINIYYGTLEGYPNKEWVMTGYDIETELSRDFALKDITFEDD